MPTNLNAGYENNINIIQIRPNGAHMQRYTDRTINDVEVTITHVSGDAVGVPSAPGGKTRSTVIVPAGFARTIIHAITETDGGIHTDSDVNQFTEGGE